MYINHYSVWKYVSSRRDSEKAFARSFLQSSSFNSTFQARIQPLQLSLIFQCTNTTKSQTETWLVFLMFHLLIFFFVFAYVCAYVHVSTFHSRSFFNGNKKTNFH